MDEGSLNNSADSEIERNSGKAVAKKTSDRPDNYFTCQVAHPNAPWHDLRTC